MRFLGSTMACLCVLAAPAYAQNTPAPRTTPAAPAAAGNQKNVAIVASYGIGMNMGGTFRTDGVDIDLDSFIQGVKDGVQGLKPKFTESQLKTAFEAFQADMQVKSEARAKAVGAKNQREGQTFLTTNRTKPGVKTTKSGLQYLVVRAGTGATPKATDTVKVHYEGFLIDGTVFDSSVKRKEPAVLQVDGVIPGWTEALQMMKTGDKWRLFVPAELAYGAAGADNAIGPNATLIFDVELLGVEPPAKEALPDPSVPK
jgi:FKBP-type peptidyl-prolyl cis-trans isomerase FklB